MEKIDLIEIEKRNELVNALKNYLAKQSISFIILNPDLPKKGKDRNHNWVIIENSTIESDE